MVTRKAGSTGQINITELVVKQTNRTTVDIKKWRDAIQAAENVASPRRSYLYDLYEDLILDGHMRSVIDKRRRAVKDLPITFTKDGDPVDQVNEFLKTRKFKNMLADLNDARFWGHSLVQIDFSGDKLKYDLIPRKHVKPEYGIVSKEEYDNTGIAYREDPEVKYILEAGGNKDLGLILPAAQYVIWKRGGFGDWAELAELFGRPLRKGKYNPNDAAGKAALLAMLETLGGAPYIAYPEGTDVTVDASGSNLTGDIYDSLKNACNTEISKIFLGSTLTTEQGEKGARSLGEVHERGEHDVFVEDREDIISLLNNEFLTLLQIHGFPVEGGEFTYQDTEELSREVQLNMVNIMRNNLQLPIDDDYIYETFDIPKPVNYDQLKADAAAAAAARLAAFAPPAPPDLQSGGKGPGSPDPAAPPAKGAKNNKPAEPSASFASSSRPLRETFSSGINKFSNFQIFKFFSSLFGQADDFTSKTRTEARRIAKMIYDGSLPDGFVVDESMVKLIADYLRQAIEEGYGNIAGFETGSAQRILGENLIRNAFKFSAAKTQAMQNDMKAIMVGADGGPLSFSKFRQVVDALNINYNKNWIETEWNTSVSNAQMADKWSGFEDDADVMPMLQFITAGDDRVREEHAALDGTIRPVDDPFWDMYYPPLDWGCRCDVIQVTDPDAKPTDVAAMKLPEVPEQFANNPAKSGEIFTDKNPTMSAASSEAKDLGSKLADEYLKGLV